MSESEHIAIALEEIFTAGGPFLPFTAATDGLSAAQAAAIPAPRFNSVWAVVNHMSFWQETLILLLRGLPIDFRALGAPDPRGWPPAGAPDDEAAWQAARARTIAGNTELAQLVASLSDQALGRQIEAWRIPGHRAVQGIMAHNSYHICEIISIRHMLGLWLENA